MRGQAKLQAGMTHQHPASSQLLKHFEQPQLTSVRSVVNECGDEKVDASMRRNRPARRRPLSPPQELEWTKRRDRGELEAQLGGLWAGSGVLSNSTWSQLGSSTRWLGAQTQIRAIQPALTLESPPGAVFGYFDLLHHLVYVGFRLAGVCLFCRILCDLQVFWLLK